MNKILKKLWESFTSVLVIIVLLLAILLGVPRFINIQPLVVLSGSMEPVFMTGSLVYVKEIETSSLEVGDVITFYQDEETVVTHRIIEVVNTEEVPGGIGYRTKGDANELEDAFLVPPVNVIGEAMFAIPYLGYFAQYVQDPPGLYIAIAVGAGLILLMFLPDLFAKEEEETKEKQSKKSGKKKSKEVVSQIDEEDRDIEIIVSEEADIKVKQVRNATNKPKRPLTPEEKKELARRRRLYEERKRELARQRLLVEEDID